MLHFSGVARNNIKKNPSLNIAQTRLAGGFFFTAYIFFSPYTKPCYTSLYDATTAGVARNNNKKNPSLNIAQTRLVEGIFFTALPCLSLSLFISIYFSNKNV